MAVHTKRVTIAPSGSTSSSGTGSPAGRISSRSRSVGRLARAARSGADSRPRRRCRRPGPCAGRGRPAGSQAWRSPSRRKRTRPKSGSLRRSSVSNAAAWRSSTGARARSKPRPPMRLGVPAEAALDDASVEAEALEDLAAAIAGDGRDAHLGHDLEQALVGGLEIVVLGGVGVGIVLVRRAEGARAAQRQPRADRAGAVADQRGQVVHVPRVAGLDDQVHVACADQLASRRWWTAPSASSIGIGAARRVHVSIRQDQDLRAVARGRLGAGAHVVERRLQRLPLTLRASRPRRWRRAPRRRSR